MSGNLIRDIHDAVAFSDKPAEASVRSPGTTPRELGAMRRDVLHKLQLHPRMSAAEIGCGVGLLGVPVAKRTTRYLGLDFAPRAVQVANERLRAAGVGHRARAICVDVLTIDREKLLVHGHFDRVLMYGVLHYARTESEVALFLQRAIDLLAPGGRALIGSIPLDDLEVDWTPREPAPAGLIMRLIAAVQWVMTPGSAPVPLTRRWKSRRVGEAMLRSCSSAEHFTPARLPPNYTISLTTAAVERGLATQQDGLVHRWELPAPGTPLAYRRADLIIVRR